MPVDPSIRAARAKRKGKLKVEREERAKRSKLALCASCEATCIRKDDNYCPQCGAPIARLVE